MKNLYSVLLLLSISQINIHLYLELYSNMYFIIHWQYNINCTISSPFLCSVWGIPRKKKRYTHINFVDFLNIFFFSVLLLLLYKWTRNNIWYRSSYKMPGCLHYNEIFNRLINIYTNINILEHLVGVHYLGMFLLLLLFCWSGLVCYLFSFIY